MDDLTLAQMNWEICLANLIDAIKYLRECREHLEKALKNIGELRDA
jgi:exonuclease VII small subunit